VFHGDVETTIHQVILPMILSFYPCKTGLGEEAAAAAPVISVGNLRRLCIKIGC